MTTLVFAFLAFFGWGIGILFEAIAARKFDSYSVLFWGFLLSLSGTSLYTPFVFSNLNNLSFYLLLVCIAVALFWIGGMIAYYDGLKKGNPTIVTAIANSFPASVVVFSILFLNERVNSNQLLAIIIILVGLLLSGLNLKTLSKEKLFKDRGVVLAIVAMLSWGVAFTFIKIPVQSLGWFWPNYFVLTFTPIIFLFMRLRKIKLHWPPKSIWIPLIIATILLRLAEFSYNFAISKGLVAIVAPIAGANPILFVPLAFFVFKQPVTRQQFVGIVLTLAGIILLSFFSA